MFEKKKEKAAGGFLDRIAASYGEEVDADGAKKQAAIQYLEDHGMNPDDFEDLTKASDDVQKEQDRLMKVMETLVDQGSKADELAWVNDESNQNNNILQGIIGIMLEMYQEPAVEEEME